jgi:hypothetical protein
MSSIICTILNSSGQGVPGVHIIVDVKDENGNIFSQFQSLSSLSGVVREWYFLNPSLRWAAGTTTLPPCSSITLTFRVSHLPRCHIGTDIKLLGVACPFRISLTVYETTHILEPPEFEMTDVFEQPEASAAFLLPPELLRSSSQREPMKTLTWKRLQSSNLASEGAGTQLQETPQRDKFRGRGQTNAPVVGQGQRHKPVGYENPVTRVDKRGKGQRRGGRKRVTVATWADEQPGRKPKFRRVSDYAGAKGLERTKRPFAGP